MNQALKGPALAAFVMIFVSGAGLAEAADNPGKTVFDRTVEITNEAFYRPSQLDAFNLRAEEILADNDDFTTADPARVEAAIDALLASLKTSHTARYTADEVAYFELVDVFRFNFRDQLRRLFPPDGGVSYDGIGLATREIDGKLFVSDVYDGGPASRANVMAGDEIIAVDGEDFTEIASFAEKAGKEVVLTLRRDAGGPTLDIKVGVEKLQPSEALLDAISDSVTVINRDGRRIGYIRIWSYTRSAVGRILASELGDGRLANVDGLVLDLRSRWGGAPADAAEIFVGGTPDMRMIERDGKTRFVNGRWQKPVVAIIDEGTRSGMELFANALQANDIPLVGTPTAGAVVGGRGFLLPDDSLLVMAVVDVLVDGKRLEGNPVEPDIEIPFDFRYAAGADPQLDAAVEEMIRILPEA